MFKRNRKPSCPIPGCDRPGEPGPLTFLTPNSVDVCAPHAEERAIAARAAWVDPALLTLEAWTGGAMLASRGGEANGAASPCGACGHPRWAHAVVGMFDGPCVVPECVACDGEPGHSPGYQPSSAVHA